MGSRSAFVVPLRAGELSSPGPRRREEGRRRAERVIAGKQGKGQAPCQPVNVTTMDSRAGGRRDRLTGEWLSGDRTDSYGPPPHIQRSSPAKNRMRECRTSGSVGGEGGNILAYPAAPYNQAGTEELRSLMPRENQFESERTAFRKGTLFSYPRKHIWVAKAPAPCRAGSCPRAVRRTLTMEP
jgi:hypothetical protein